MLLWLSFHLCFGDLRPSFAGYETPKMLFACLSVPFADFSVFWVIDVQLTAFIVL